MTHLRQSSLGPQRVMCLKTHSLSGQTFLSFPMTCRTRGSGMTSGAARDTPSQRAMSCSPRVVGHQGTKRGWRASARAVAESREDNVVLNDKFVTRDFAMSAPPTGPSTWSGAARLGKTTAQTMCSTQSRMRRT